MDVTEFYFHGEKLYLSPILDLYTLWGYLSNTLAKGITVAIVANNYTLIRINHKKME